MKKSQFSWLTMYPYSVSDIVGCYLQPANIFKFIQKSANCSMYYGNDFVEQGNVRPVVETVVAGRDLAGVKFLIFHIYESFINGPNLKQVRVFCCILVLVCCEIM